jgi:hypothetical protein
MFIIEQNRRKCGLGKGTCLTTVREVTTKMLEISSGSVHSIPKGKINGYNHHKICTLPTWSEHKFLVNNKMGIIPNPPYLSDLAPCDFFPS